MTAAATLRTQFGPVTVTETGGAISSLSFGGDAGAAETPLLAEALRQVAAYCAGTLRAFDLPLALSEGLAGAVQREMLAIPFGETRTYGAIARALAAPAQAVGQACGANRIPLIVPCHRVLAATGLGGFSAAGGVETKVALLRHEGAASLLI